MPQASREGTQQSSFVFLGGKSSHHWELASALDSKVSTRYVHLRWIGKSTLGTCIWAAVESQRSVRAFGVLLEVNTRYEHLGWLRKSSGLGVLCKPTLPAFAVGLRRLR